MDGGRVWRGKGRGWVTREQTSVMIQAKLLSADSFWFSPCSSPKAGPLYLLFKDENT